MAKLTLSALVNLENETTAVASINANWDLIEAALENTLSRDGTTPNTMSASLDMNSQQIINLPYPSTQYSPLRIRDVADAANITFTDSSVLTSPFMLTVLDDTTASAARTTLGVAIGTDVQAFDSGLSALASFNTNGILTQTANNTFVGRTLTGTSNQVTVTNGDGVSGNPTVSLPAIVTGALQPAGGTVGQVLTKKDSSDSNAQWTSVSLGLTALTNVQINATVASNALTFAVKTAAGNDPSATDPIYVTFRSATLTSGAIVTRAITSALSITVPAFQALGTINATASRIWLDFIDNAGTVELAVKQNAVFASSLITRIGTIDETSLISTTAIATAPSADVWYSTTARTAVAHRIAGYCEFSGGQATAGTWATSPSKVQVASSMIKRPGDAIQVAYGSTTTATTNTTTTLADTTLTTTITTGVATAVAMAYTIGDISNGGTASMAVKLAAIRGSTTISTNALSIMAVAGNDVINASGHAFDFPNASGSTVYKVQFCRGNATAGTITAQLSGAQSTMIVTEYMT